MLDLRHLRDVRDLPHVLKRRRRPGPGRQGARSSARVLIPVRRDRRHGGSGPGPRRPGARPSTTSRSASELRSLSRRLARYRGATSRARRPAGASRTGLRGPSNHWDARDHPRTSSARGRSLAKSSRLAVARRGIQLGVQPPGQGAVAVMVVVRQGSRQVAWFGRRAGRLAAPAAARGSSRRGRPGSGRAVPVGPARPTGSLSDTIPAPRLRSGP